jgi:hypothetical protein
MAPYYIGRPLSALPDVCKAYKLKATQGRRRSRSRRPRCATASATSPRRAAGAGASMGCASTTPPRRHGAAGEQRAPGLQRPRGTCCRPRKGDEEPAGAHGDPHRVLFRHAARRDQARRAARHGVGAGRHEERQPAHRADHPRVAVCARRFNRATPKITIQRNWEKARAKVGLHGMHFHDWRHSASERADQRRRRPLHRGAAVLGHKDPRSTQRYAHLAVKKLSEAVGRIGRKNPATLEKKAA